MVFDDNFSKNSMFSSLSPIFASIGYVILFFSKLIIGTIAFSLLFVIISTRFFIFSVLMSLVFSKVEPDFLLCPVDFTALSGSIFFISSCLLVMICSFCMCDKSCFSFFAPKPNLPISSFFLSCCFSVTSVSELVDSVLSSSFLSVSFFAVKNFICFQSLITLNHSLKCPHRSKSYYCHYYHYYDMLYACWKGAFSNFSCSYA